MKHYYKPNSQNAIHAWLQALAERDEITHKQANRIWQSVKDSEITQISVNTALSSCQVEYLTRTFRFYSFLVGPRGGLQSHPTLIT